MRLVTGKDYRAIIMATASNHLDEAHSPEQGTFEGYEMETEDDTKQSLEPASPRSSMAPKTQLSPIKGKPNVNEKKHRPNLHLFPTVGSPPSPVPPKRSALDAMIENLATGLSRRASNHDCDTLIFIDPPSFTVESNSLHALSARAYFDKAFYASSRRLMNLESSFFDRQLGEACQYSIKRKRHLTTLPGGIRYVLDLTPKSEGEDAVQYLLDLSCPLGVRLWFESASRWDVPASLVSGQDEFSQLDGASKRQRIEEAETPAGQAAGAWLSENGTSRSDALKSPSFANRDPFAVQEVDTSEPEPEYTQLRHRLAIEKFLLALQGQDTKFDSAIKIFTTAMVTKAYEIRACNPITDSVVGWLHTDANSRFLEALPEAVLNMAEALRAETLARDSFAVLVGEAVLDSAQNHTSPSMTCFGRRRLAVDESWQSRIEYARNSLTERVQKCFYLLAGSEMAWIDSLRTMAALKRRLSASDVCLATYSRLSECVRKYMRGAIYHVLYSEYTNMNPFGYVERKGGERLYPKQAAHYLWSKLSPSARTSSRFFWQLVASLRFENHWCNYQFPDDITNFNLVRTRYGLAGVIGKFEDAQRSKDYQEVKYTDLSEAVKGCQAHLPEGFQAAYRYPCYFSRCSDNHEDFTSKCLRCKKRFCSRHHAGSSHQCYGSFQLNGQSFQASAQSTSGAHLSSAVPFRPALAEVPRFTANRENLTIDPDSDDSELRGDFRDSDSQDVSDETYTLLQGILSEAGLHMQEVGASALVSADGGHLGNTLDVYMTPALLCLSQSNELCYLPLWAGGLDDGTSGVFNPSAPPDEDGFTGPPAATNELSASGLGEDYDMADDRRTIATSAIVNDGYGDSLNRHKVYAMSEVDSVDWGFMRNGKASGAQGAADRGQATVNATATLQSRTAMDGNDETLSIDSDSGAITPTGAQTPSIDTMDDIFMETSDHNSDIENMLNESGDDESALNRAGGGPSAESAAEPPTTTDQDESYALDTESVSYGGFSDSETSSAGMATPSYTGESPKPGDSADTTSSIAGPSKVSSGIKTAKHDPDEDTIGSDLRSRYANVYYVYKDGPEEDPLLTRP